MANYRALRFTCDSRRVNKLTETAEIVFYRLIQLADDFGSYIMDTELILSAMFPRKTPNRREMTEEVLQAALDELSSEALDMLQIYEHGGKKYLRIRRFNQRLQNFRSAWPHPVDEISPGVTVNHRESRSEEEEEPEVEPEFEVERESEIMKRKQNALPQMLKYLKKNQRRLFPSELHRAQQELNKLLEQNGWSENLFKQKPDEQKKFDTADERIWQKHLGKVMAAESEKCFMHYAKQNFKIKGEPIVAWMPVIAGWMQRRSEFANRK
jgi:hypothetical protein